MSLISVFLPHLMTGNRMKRTVTLSAPVDFSGSRLVFLDILKKKCSKWIVSLLYLFSQQEPEAATLYHVPPNPPDSFNKNSDFTSDLICQFVFMCDFRVLKDRSDTQKQTNCRRLSLFELLIQINIFILTVDQIDLQYYP